MDFSFEKTNSAYMLFYERIPRDSSSASGGVSSTSEAPSSSHLPVPRVSETVSRPPSTSTSATSPDSRGEGEEPMVTTATAGQEETRGLQDDQQPKITLSKDLAEVRDSSMHIILALCVSSYSVRY